MYILVATFLGISQFRFFSINLDSTLMLIYVMFQNLAMASSRSIQVRNMLKIYRRHPMHLSTRKTYAYKKITLSCCLNFLTAKTEKASKHCIGHKWQVAYQMHLVLIQHIYVASKMILLESVLHSIFNFCFEPIMDISLRSHQGSGNLILSIHSTCKWYSNTTETHY